MNTRTVLAALVGAISAFLLGWVIFGMMLMDFMSAHMLPYPGLMKGEGEMDLGLIFLSNLLIAVLLTRAFGRMGVHDLKSGLLNGTIIGLLFYLAMDLSLMAMMNLYDGPLAVAVDVLANTVWMAAIGGVVGFMLGRGQAKA